MRLPAPKARFEVENLFAFVPGQKKRSSRAYPLP
jgi:hypothetical protein